MPGLAVLGIKPRALWVLGKPHLLRYTSSPLSALFRVLLCVFPLPSLTYIFLLGISHCKHFIELTGKAGPLQSSPLMSEYAWAEGQETSDDGAHLPPMSFPEMSPGKSCALLSALGCLGNPIQGLQISIPSSTLTSWAS